MNTCLMAISRGLKTAFLSATVKRRRTQQEPMAVANEAHIEFIPARQGNAKTILPLLLLMTVSAFASAPPPMDDGCSSALKKDLLISETDDESQHVVLYSMTEQDFQTYKNDSSLAAAIPGLGALLAKSNTFEEFRRYLDSQYASYNRTSHRARSVFQITSSVAYVYWAQCKQTEARRAPGVYAWKEREDNRSVLINVFWNAGSEATREHIPVAGTVQGGKAAGRNDNNLFPTGSEIVRDGNLGVTVVRTGNEDVSVDIHAGNSPRIGIESKYLTPAPPTPLVTPPPYGNKPNTLLRIHQSNIPDGNDATGSGDWLPTLPGNNSLEGFFLYFSPALPNLHFQYMCHISGIGDQPWFSEGERCGTTGRGLNMEGFAIRLIGPDANKYSVQYQCSAAAIGVMPGRFQDGDFCGTRRQLRTLFSMKVWVSAK